MHKLQDLFFDYCCAKYECWREEKIRLGCSKDALEIDYRNGVAVKQVRKIAETFHSHLSFIPYEIPTVSCLVVDFFKRY